MKKVRWRLEYVMISTVLVWLAGSVASGQDAVGIFVPNTATASSSVDTEGPSTTVSLGLSRFTCDSLNGFLDPRCDESLYGPCAEGTVPVALTTDFFVGEWISVENAQDGDRWVWTWDDPEGPVEGPFGSPASASLEFFEFFEGEQNCFVARTFLKQHVFCDRRSASYIWATSAVRGGLEGIWQSHVSVNGVPLDPPQPFELFKPARPLFNGFEDLELKNGRLIMDFDLAASDSDSGGWNLEVRAGLSADELSQAALYYIAERGPNTIVIDLPEHEIGRFADDAVLTVDTVTATNDETYLTTSTQCVPPFRAATSVAIPLPVVFVHGYVPPDIFCSAFTRILLSRFISPFQADDLFDFLIESSETLAGLTSEFRVPYARDVLGEPAPPYLTLSVAQWDLVAGQGPSVVGDTIKNKILAALDDVYASRANVIAHSAGGVAARLAIWRDAPVRKLIMVGTPNNGTSQAYVAASRCSPEEIDRLVASFALLLLPRIDGAFGTRGPYDVTGNQCSLLRPLPPPLVRTLEIGLPPADVEVTNIFTKKPFDPVHPTRHANTLWDTTARPHGLWFHFMERQLMRAEKCSPGDDWLSLRTGDTFVATSDARLGVGDVEIETETKHVRLLDDPGVRFEIARALGLVP